MKPSRAIGVGVALTAVAGWAWVGCGSSNNTTNTGTNTGTATNTSQSSGPSSTASSVSASSTAMSESSSTGTSASTSTGSAAPPSFATSIYPGLSANCVVCHHQAGDPMPGDAGIYDASGGGFLLGKLDMATVDAAYANLVNVPASGTGLPGFEDAGQIACDTLDAATPGHIRVVPNDAGQSLLCLKLKGYLVDGSTPCGDPMPLAVPVGDGGILFGELSNQQAVFTAVQEWINGGANP